MIDTNTSIQTQNTNINTKINTNDYKNIITTYSGNNEHIKKKKTKTKIDNNKYTQAISNYTKDTSPRKKVYELIGTGSDVNGFLINIISNTQIPDRNPNMIPQIPAMISGNIDGKPFSLTIPSDLNVKDFKIKVVNQETEEIKYIPLEEEHIKSGSFSVLNIDTNNFENIELRSNSSSMPPTPPLPSMPMFR
jgi:hypothetical protein